MSHDHDPDQQTQEAPALSPVRLWLVYRPSHHAQEVRQPDLSEYPLEQAQG
jgi:hypothetical protein